MKIINLTPHPINIIGAENKTIATINSDGVARLQSSTVSAGSFGGIPITKTVYGVPTGLPDFEPGVFIIVSQIIKNAYPDRIDLLVPSEVVRDSDGKVIGCRSLGI